MQTIKNLIFSFAMLLLMASCAVTDIDKTANFQQYRTYKWSEAKVDVQNPLYNSELIDKNIKENVEREFANRGIVVNKAHPDFLVSYQTYTENKQRTTSPSYYGFPYTPYRFFPYAFGYGWGMPFAWSNPPRTETITEGTLIIDIKDAKTQELVWRGSVSGDLNDVAALQKQIRKAIKAIMKKYPVTPSEAFPLPANNAIS